MAFFDKIKVSPCLNVAEVDPASHSTRAVRPKGPFTLIRFGNCERGVILSKTGLVEREVILNMESAFPLPVGYFRIISHSLATRYYMKFLIKWPHS